MTDEPFDRAANLERARRLQRQAARIDEEGRTVDGRLTITAAAAELGITRPAIFNALRRGQIHAECIKAQTRTGYAYVIEPDELARYRARNKAARQRKDQTT